MRFLPRFLTRDRAAPAIARPEARSVGLEEIQSGDPRLHEFFRQGRPMTDEPVTIDTALQVPAVWGAVSFLSRTLARLPLPLYDNDASGVPARNRTAPEAAIFERAANPTTPAFEARRVFWQNVFTHGRGLAYVERALDGAVRNLWPLDPARVTVRHIRPDGAPSLEYSYSVNGRITQYRAEEIIDLRFMTRSDGLSAFSPIYSNAATIGLALALTRYGAKVFRNGGVPPFIIEGPMRSPQAAARAAADLTEIVARANENGDIAIAVPEGHKIHKLGFNPGEVQMIEARAAARREIATIYGLPPLFLQDLEHASLANSEQQDLHLVKHLLAQWAAALEGELNLKLIGRDQLDRYFQHDLDGIVRGDLRARSEARRTQINTGQRTINEVRAEENLPALEGGDVALVQGAMIPLTAAGANLTQQGALGGADADQEGATDAE